MIDDKLICIQSYEKNGTTKFINIGIIWNEEGYFHKLESLKNAVNVETDI